MTNKSVDGNSISSAECIWVAVSTCNISIPERSSISSSESCGLAKIIFTWAPRSRAARATAAPCRPLERFPIKRTGSIASRVPPAVTRTRLPRKSFFTLTRFSNSPIIVSVSGNLPWPTSSPVNLPTAGSKIVKPRVLSVFTFSCVAGSCHICGCIAGTIKTGTSRAKTKLVSKSSARPAVIRAIKSAVAGAIISASALFASEICRTSSTLSQTWVVTAR